MERKKITNQPNRFIKEKFEQLREEFGNKCHICNELYDLEFHPVFLFYASFNPPS